MSERTGYTSAQVKEMAESLSTEAAAQDEEWIARAGDMLDEFAAVLEQRCETCRFAGAVDRRRLSFTDREPVDARQCRLLGDAGVGNYGYQFVPLEVNGKPFSCAGWQPHAAPRTGE